jgi:hypothetical protein
MRCCVCGVPLDGFFFRVEEVFEDNLLKTAFEGKYNF